MQKFQKKREGFGSKMDDYQGTRTSRRRRKKGQSLKRLKFYDFLSIITEFAYFRSCLSFSTPLFHAFYVVAILTACKEANTKIAIRFCIIGKDRKISKLRSSRQLAAHVLKMQVHTSFLEPYRHFFYKKK